MRYLAILLLAMVCQLGLAPAGSQAVPITNIYNTGVNNSGNAWLTAGTPDIHYTVTTSPSGSFVPVAIDDTTFPFPPWFPNNTFSRWIGPAAQYGGGPNGFYAYRTTFTLPGNAILSSVSISGLWGTDDPGNDILINANSTGQVSAGFTSLVPFSINSGFVVGLNTIDFLLANVGGGPTGLRVDGIKGTYQVPEPYSLAMAFGCSSLWALRRRR